MLLALDIGNTNLHVGLFDGEALVYADRVPQDGERTWGQLGLMLRMGLDLAGSEPSRLDGVAVSCVVPAVVETVRRSIRKHLECEAMFAGAELVPRLQVRYDPPTAVGADRLLNALAAVRRFGGPVVAIDCGSATTVDVVNAAGEYVGGAILAGAQSALEGLLARATHLPPVSIKRPERLIGGTTSECMQAGAYWGFVEQIDGLARRYRAELGPATRVIGAGGGIDAIRGDLKEFEAFEPWLTLHGLRIAWDERNG